MQVPCNPAMWGRSKGRRCDAKMKLRVAPMRPEKVGSVADVRLRPHLRLQVVRPPVWAAIAFGDPKDLGHMGPPDITDQKMAARS